MNVDKESIYHCELTLNGYEYKFDTFNGTDSYIWHASVEAKSIRRVLELKIKGIRFHHQVFENVGHAGMAAIHLARLKRHTMVKQ